MNILLTGGSGQLGRALLSRLSTDATVTAPPRSVMDLADEENLRQYIRQLRPDLIINTAAYTAVNQAESDAVQCSLINAHAPCILAQEAFTLGVPLIHFSTDYVFDGNRSAPYRENDRTMPLNVYGRSKAAGEKAIERHCDAYWIFRTSWLYSAEGSNFLTTMMRLAREKEALNVVNDQWGAPTWTDTIAKVLTSILRTAPEHRLAPFVKETSGIYHLTADGATNWHAYARMIVNTLAAQGQSLAVGEKDIHPVSSESYGAAAARPRNSRLSCEKFITTFGTALPPWDAALAECMAKMCASGQQEQQRGEASP